MSTNTQAVRITIPSESTGGDVLRINVPGVGLRDVIFYKTLTKTIAN